MPNNKDSFVLCGPLYFIRISSLTTACPNKMMTEQAIRLIQTAGLISSENREKPLSINARRNMVKKDAMLWSKSRSDFLGVTEIESDMFLVYGLT